MSDKKGQYPISSGIPIPPPTASPVFGRLPKYPWESMEAGDSFFIPGKKMFTAHQSYMKSAKGAGKQFVVRRVKEGGAFGVRVWRMK